VGRIHYNKRNHRYNLLCRVDLGWVLEEIEAPRSSRWNMVCLVRADVGPKLCFRIDP
jgi:hypothetical protein